MKEAEDKYSISSEQLLQGGYTISVPLDVSIQKAAYTLMKQDAIFPEQTIKLKGAPFLSITGQAA